MVDKRVVVFFGLTGSGKSYLASRWAAGRNYPYFNSDETRKELAGLQPDSRHHVPFNKGLYSPEMTRRTYLEMIQRAAASIDGLEAGGVVLDGCFGRQEQRRAVIEQFAGRTRIWFVLCFCSERVTGERFLLRAEDRGAVSDGRWEIYNGQKKTFSIPDQLDGAHLCKLDTDQHIDTLIVQVDRCIDLTN
jgi:predicted kinase